MSRQKIFTMSRAAFAVAFGMIACVAFAGPLEDARGLYNAGKFDEVDAKLGALLERRPVPMDVLKLSFDAAVKAGRPYTAERRYAAMQEKQNDSIPADVVFRAALVAGEIGKPTVRRDRLIFFLQKDTGWNDNVECALGMMCRDGGAAAYYTRFMQHMPANDATFQLGLDMLANMRSGKRTADYNEQLATLLSKFKSDSQVHRIFADVSRYITEVCQQTPITRELFTTLSKFPVHNHWWYQSFIGRCYNDFSCGEVLQYCLAHNELLPIYYFNRIGRFRDTYRDPEIRKAEAVKFKKLEPFVRAKETNQAGQSILKFKDHLYEYIVMVVRNSDVFMSEEAPLYTKDAFAAMYTELADAFYNGDISKIRSITNEICDHKLFTEDQIKTLTEKYPRYFGYNQLVVMPKLLDRSREVNNANAYRQLFDKVKDVHDLKMQCFGDVLSLKDFGLAFSILEEYILDSPFDFNAGFACNYINAEGARPLAERVNNLRSIYQKTGFNRGWESFSKNKFPDAIKDDANLKAFIAEIKPGVKGTHPIYGPANAIHYQKQGADNACPAEAFALAESALKAYNGSYPDFRRPTETRAVHSIWDKITSLCKNPQDNVKLVKLFLPKLGKDRGYFDVLADRARQAKEDALYFDVYKAGLKVGVYTADELYQYQVPGGFDNFAILEPYYKDMKDPGRAAWQVASNCQRDGSGKKRWSDETKIRNINALFNAHAPATIPEENLYQILDEVAALAQTNSYVARLPLEKLAVTFFDEQQGSTWLRTRVVTVFNIAGKQDVAVKRYLDGARKLDPVSRYNAINTLLSQEWGFNGKWTYAVSDAPDNCEEVPALSYAGIFRDELVPLLKTIPLKNTPLLRRFEPNHFLDAYGNINTFGRGWKVENVKAACHDFCTEVALRRDRGLTTAAEQWRMYHILRSGLHTLIDANRYAEAATFAGIVGSSYADHVDNQGNGLRETVKKCINAGAWEIAFLVASRAGTGNGGLASDLQRYRSDCSTHMPGIYPVDERSPLYPLYVAADELERNNPERAWTLLQQNSQTFEREAIKFPADFIAWAVEQLRHARGQKDTMLLKARAIATKLLANESSLTPELAAALMLTRAECYRDQRNYEAARLEYQSIRNGNYYKGTKSARKAMYRDVDLLIEMGNIGQAEQLIEYWISQPDVEIQAEAHYFLARIAFERKDYEETRKQLDQVFELDFTHTDARLLHGKWKLATNNEVDDTNVLIGNISDRKMIRPGQDIQISVQDRNLGVAGGGASIPVIITTSVGKDIENLALYPSVRNPYIFNGNIPTRLGKAVSTNRVVEVCGDDVVSYRIDPDFLKARGLAVTGEKQLVVIDDARLAIGAAAPRAEEGAAEADLERIITSSGSSGTDRSNLSSSLKPGNPIYIVVRDRDRSVNANTNSVVVDVRTSSGDRLEGVELKETGETTGIFRGSIPTALPPPRAFASDTAAGSNAGDTINSTRNGSWKSVADGAQGKWLQVDTMGSYCVSNASIVMPDPKQVKSIRLVGELLGETIRLGSLPKEDIKSRYGIKYQVAQGSKLNSASLIRTAFSAKNAVKPKDVKGLAFTPDQPNRDVNQNAMLSAAFQMPEGQTKMRFFLQAKDTKGRTLAGLWMAIAVDGVTVFTGQGNSLHRRNVEFDVTQGAHQLEIFFSASYPDDALDILVVDEEGNPVPFPAEWVDPVASPALEEFVCDKAEITATNNGFCAVLSNPVRVRSLRWEFLGYNGRELEVTELTLVDDSGKQIIPSEHDFTDALKNKVLEVAPGDRIVVTYADEKTTKGEKRVLERSLGSSFNDAHVDFFFESMTMKQDGPHTELFKAYRFLPGDPLIISVDDPDGDISPDADKVNVRITTKSGVEKDIQLVEKAINQDPNSEDTSIHGGHFRGQLRTCAAGDTNAPPSVIRIAPGDIVTMTYFDRENTRPGIPVERTASIAAAQASTPELTLFHTYTRLEEDTSADAKIRLAQLRRRPGNESLEKLYRTVTSAEVLTDEEMKDGETNLIPANVATSIPILVKDRSRARHSASVIKVEALAASEIEDAENIGREPEKVTINLALGNNIGISCNASFGDTVEDGVFSGSLGLRLGPPDPSEYSHGDTKAKKLSVNGNDIVIIRILDENDKPIIERKFQLCSAGSISIKDSTLTADRNMVHIGEKFYIVVNDADQDKGDDIDEIMVDVTANTELRDPNGQVSKKAISRKVLLKETLPHSGIFAGIVRPVMFTPEEEIPAVSTGAVVTASEELSEDRIASGYGDTLTFTYNDEVAVPGVDPGLHCVTGGIFKGSNGKVRMFSKRFRDSDMAVLVQFRLAECLFESAKEHRRLKQPEKSAQAIADGKFILEEALRNYPTTIHVTQGEFLLANLYYELGMEEKEAIDKAKKEGEMEGLEDRQRKADALFTEALSRFSSILGTWPDCDVAPRCQYHKALCLEMLGDYNRSSEEYVKMTYLYPESPLVGDASIRLATYYYKEEKRYDTAGRIYSNFQRRFPTHEKADRALFMSAQCHMKQAETIAAEDEEVDARKKRTTLVKDEYMEAVTALNTLIETYRDTSQKALLAQAMYWAGDASLRAENYEKAYLYLKRTTFEYPETEWARRARGLLLQESKAFENLE